MSDEDPFLGREMHKSRQFSEHTMELIDDEVHEILQNASNDAATLMVKHRAELEKVTQALLKDEELDRKEIAALIGPSVHQQRKDNNEKRIVKYVDMENGDSAIDTQDAEQEVSESGKG